MQQLRDDMQTLREKIKARREGWTLLRRDTSSALPQDYVCARSSSWGAANLARFGSGRRRRGYKRLAPLLAVAVDPAALFNLLTGRLRRRILQAFLLPAMIGPYIAMSNAIYVSTFFYFYYYAFDPGG
jgi:hypothetical protein